TATARARPAGSAPTPRRPARPDPRPGRHTQRRERGGARKVSSASSWGPAARAECGAADAVENAVDERPRGRRRELLRDLDGLVDHDGIRRVLFVEKLVEREAKEVAVHRRHAPEAPVLGALGEPRIQLVAPRERA